jgi:hypothetical protein
MHTQHESCIAACHDCAVACEHCASACLQEPDVIAMARCIELDRDCARICFLASAAMAAGSEFTSEICALCAQICRACTEECRKHKPEHCQRCADACERCAGECESMARAA